MADREWTAPVEVGVEEMGRRTGMHPARLAFYRDVRLRLEQTGKGRAVCYEFADAKTARLYQHYARARSLVDMGALSLSSTFRPHADGSASVYFTRGPKYPGTAREPV